MGDECLEGLVVSLSMDMYFVKGYTSSGVWKCEMVPRGCRPKGVLDLLGKWVRVSSERKKKSKSKTKVEIIDDLHETRNENNYPEVLVDLRFLRRSGLVGLYEHDYFGLVSDSLFILDEVKPDALYRVWIQSCSKTGENGEEWNITQREAIFKPPAENIVRSPLLDVVKVHTEKVVPVEKAVPRKVETSRKEPPVEAERLANTETRRKIRGLLTENNVFKNVFVLWTTEDKTNTMEVPRSLCRDKEIGVWGEFEAIGPSIVKFLTIIPNIYETRIRDGMVEIRAAFQHFARFDTFFELFVNDYLGLIADANQIMEGCVQHGLWYVGWLTSQKTVNTESQWAISAEPDIVGPLAEECLHQFGFEKDNWIAKASDSSALNRDAESRKTDIHPDRQLSERSKSRLQPEMLSRHGENKLSLENQPPVLTNQAKSQKAPTNGGISIKGPGIDIRAHDKSSRLQSADRSSSVRGDSVLPLQSLRAPALSNRDYVQSNERQSYSNQSSTSARRQYPEERDSMHCLLDDNPPYRGEVGRLIEQHDVGDYRNRTLPAAPHVKDHRFLERNNSSYQRDANRDSETSGHGFYLRQSPDRSQKSSSSVQQRHPTHWGDGAHESSIFRRGSSPCSSQRSRSLERSNHSHQVSSSARHQSPRRDRQLRSRSPSYTNNQASEVLRLQNNVRRLENFLTSLNENQNIRHQMQMTEPDLYQQLIQLLPKKINQK